MDEFFIFFNLILGIQIIFIALIVQPYFFLVTIYISSNEF